MDEAAFNREAKSSTGSELLVESEESLPEGTLGDTNEIKRNVISMCE